MLDCTKIPKERFLILLKNELEFIQFYICAKNWDDVVSFIDKQEIGYTKEQIEYVKEQLWT